eukprot:TRINITY_DN11283_c0_g1_i7.p3 TRINITY_DN11283_c0_g1~~TRINITY_DN11283_c0_g1_i7.p3  ORF type:complete len:129 (-),score=28.08 TRINITY_DN11283_c0_g1_i7:661-1047(-)
MILMAILLFGLGTVAIITGVVLVIVGILHFIIWLFFRDLIAEDLPKDALNDDVKVPTPELSDYTYSGALSSDSSTNTFETSSSSTPSQGYGTEGTYGTGAPRNTEAYSVPPSYDSSGSDDDENASFKV